MSADHSMRVEFTVHDASGFCRDLPTLLACARAGAAAWGQLPRSGTIDGALRPEKVAEILTMCDELEAAYECSIRELEARWKQETRDRQRADREAVA